MGGEARLACCVCDNYQQPINTQAAPHFLLQPMQYSPVCGHTGSQCFDEGDRGNWVDRWFHGTRVGTRVGHMGPGYPSTRVLTFLTRKIVHIATTFLGNGRRVNEATVHGTSSLHNVQAPYSIGCLYKCQYRHPTKLTALYE